MRRKVIPELLDTDLGALEEVTASLADLRRVSDWFGGTATTVSRLRRVADECNRPHLSVLEVAAGDGALPVAAKRRLAQQGITLELTLMDRMPSHLNAATARKVCGDALQLPFRDSSFDVVSCSLLAHHLEPSELQKFALEGLRVSRRAVLINDLIRNPIHLGLVYAGMPLFRSRLTRHDAPASVRRAYTVSEMRHMLRDISGARVEISQHYLYRMGVLLWKERFAHQAANC